MDIITPVGAGDVPALKKYSALYAAALQVELGIAVPVKFDTEKECALAYEAFRQWVVREEQWSLRPMKRGSTLYIERVT